MAEFLYEAQCYPASVRSRHQQITGNRADPHFRDSQTTALSRFADHSLAGNGDFPESFHGDPADRMIVATALAIHSQRDETQGASMTILLEVYKPRAAEALKRIAQSVEVIATLLLDARAIRGAVINGEPQFIRDLEFVANDIERLEDLARRKMVRES
jgi:hypothetical protein